MNDSKRASGEQFDLADARVAAQHQALNVAHAFQRGMRLFFEPAADQ